MPCALAARQPAWSAWASATPGGVASGSPDDLGNHAVQLTALAIGPWGLVGEVVFFILWHAQC